MARKQFAACLLLLGMALNSTAFGFGLGEIELKSFLNEPLNAQVELLDARGLTNEQVRIRLASQEDFSRLGVERAYFLTSLQFNVVINESGSGHIVVTSPEPVLEPYLDFILEARWPSGRMLREYTVLVDPPAFDQAAVAISASEVIATADASVPAKKKPEPPQSAVAADNAATPIQRTFGSEASAQAAAGEQYLVRRDETLWSIASRSRPAGVSVQQAMLDIQRLNPEAFIDGNINRIKAGYVIYLPAQAEISSADTVAAVAQVRAQNQAWEESRAHEDFRNGPSLRISAAPAVADTADSRSGEAAGAQPGASAQALEDLERANLARNEMEQRLAALENQLATLQNIVTLKDEQIAALQRELADRAGERVAAAATGQESSADADTTAVAGEQKPLPSEINAASAAATAPVLEAETVDTREPVTSSAQSSAPPVATTPAPRQTAPVSRFNLMDYLAYLLAGLLVVLLLLWLWLRRRVANADDDELEEYAAEEDQADVFADVELQDEPLALASDDELETVAEHADRADAEVVDEAVAEEKGHRGYGERRHDEYASDVETGDALAEADIYIAYGRYPQAVDLLRNAIVNEPSNPAYRLKLLEVSAETGDTQEAERQLEQLRALGAADSLARAEEVMGAVNSGGSVPQMPDLGSELEGLTADTGEQLEAEFPGLAIEEEAAELIDDDLDLSADFGDLDNAEDDAEDDEVVIATEGNEMSTKLDLARAYLDMGDDDGAKLILEEVVNEGSGEQQAEARALLERLG